MSGSNPFDDEEQFQEIMENNRLPDDSDITKEGMELESIIADATKKIREHYIKMHLAEITLGFEYTDQEGFTSWVTTHYVRK